MTREALRQLEERLEVDPDDPRKVRLGGASMCLDRRQLDSFSSS